MATIIPIGQQTVGSATVALSTFLTARQLKFIQDSGGVHRVYMQAAVGNTNQIDILYAAQIICTLYKPPTLGPLPDHLLLVDDSVGNSIDIMGITFTGTSGGDKINGYITVC